MHYCLECGTSLDFRLLDGRNREVCGKCGWVYYPQLKVGVGVLVERDGRLLLLQRAHEPWKGMWNLPAGYVEVDENPRDAAMREVLEESGLDIEVGELFRMYYFDDDPRGNGIMLVYKAKSVNGELKINAEVNSARFFLRQDIPDTLAGAGDERAVREWRKRTRENHET
jgi:ADP-ribose pyrophosphatase YjhB (NUDIX family)